MNFTSIGDLSHNFLTQRRNAALKSQLGQLTQEMATGRTSDVTRHLSGSLGYLADIEHQYQINIGLRTATEEAGLFTSTMQSALEQVATQLSEVGATTALSGTSPGPQFRASAAAMATGALDAIMSALNTDVAGRALFGGTQVVGAALDSPQALLSAAQVAVGGATDASSFSMALDAYFDTGGGFETAIYQGGSQDLAPIQLGEGQSVQLSLRADDPAFRDAMKQMVAVQLSADTTLGLSNAARDAILRDAGEAMLTGADNLIRIQASLGYAQSRIEAASSRVAAELTSLDFARNDLVAVDPFDTASELEAAQFQLETIYTLTARSSRLNLLSFLS